MIDLKKGIIKGRSGKVYRIAPDKLSTARFPHWEIMTTTLAFNMSYQQVADSYSKIYQELSGPITGMGINNAMQECKARLDFIAEHPNPEFAPRVIQFCALFCITEDEDLTTFTDDLVKQKFEDWKHIDIMDFFLLYSLQIPQFEQNYQSLKASKEVEA